MLSILAVAVFCTANAQCVEGFAEVESVTQCAQVINNTRQEVWKDANGENWYMVSSVCHVEEKK